MHFKQKLTYMALGCLFTIIGYTIASLSGNPVDAQPQADKSEPTVVDEIVCRKLRVVDENGKSLVTIGEWPVVEVFDENGKNLVTIGELPVIGGGFIHVYQPNSKFTSRGRTSISGEGIDIYNLDKHSVSIGADSNGGHMNIRHASGESAIWMGISDTDKEGFVKVLRKDQKSFIQLTGNEYGGAMAIFNKGGENVLQTSVGDKGGGIISTWDKNGYRTGRLP